MIFEKSFSILISEPLPRLPLLPQNSSFLGCMYNCTPAAPLWQPLAGGGPPRRAIGCRCASVQNVISYPINRPGKWVVENSVIELARNFL